MPEKEVDYIIGVIPEDDDRLKPFVKEGEPDPHEVIEEVKVEMGGYCDSPQSESTSYNFNGACRLMSALACVSISKRVQGSKLIGKVAANDINQRAYGDCWLLSAIASMAGYPGTIEDLFNNDTDLNPKGYKVTLYNLKDCSPNTVHIDDRIPATPYYSNAPRPYASRGLQVTNDGEIWPALLEKAVAIHCGGYHHIGRGSLPFIGFKVLTGCTDLAFFHIQPSGLWLQTEPKHVYTSNGPCSSMGRYILRGDAPKYTKDQLFALLYKADLANWPMCCGADETKNGIIGQHAYTLVRVAHVEGFKLLQIRNPHGNAADEWIGPWSDRSSMWEKHPAVKKKLRPVNANDGMYWMTVEDFVHHFTNITILEKSFKKVVASPEDPQAKRWEVLGESKVRVQKSVSSDLVGILEKFTIVEEKERHGNRVYFKKIDGKGPDQGWVSVFLGSTRQLTPMRQRWVCKKDANTREEKSVKSKKVGVLKPGAIVVEEERNGNRVRFEKISGDGPNHGWTSIFLGTGRLLARADVEEDDFVVPKPKPKKPKDPPAKKPRKEHDVLDDDEIAHFFDDKFFGDFFSSDDDW